MATATESSYVQRLEEAPEVGVQVPACAMRAAMAATDPKSSRFCFGAVRIRHKSIEATDGRLAIEIDLEDETGVPRGMGLQATMEKTLPKSAETVELQPNGIAKAVTIRGKETLLQWSIVDGIFPAVENIFAQEPDGEISRICIFDTMIDKLAKVVGPLKANIVFRFTHEEGVVLCDVRRSLDSPDGWTGGRLAWMPVALKD